MFYKLFQQCQIRLGHKSDDFMQILPNKILEMVRNRFKNSSDQKHCFICGINFKKIDEEKNRIF